MDDFNDSESGFINEPDKEFGVTTGLTDVEILRISRINVIARGRRFGRRWLLKALRPELRESPSYQRHLQKEFEIHSRLHNPAVVQAVSFEDVEGLGMCIVEPASSIPACPTGFCRDVRGVGARQIRADRYEPLR